MNKSKFSSIEIISILSCLIFDIAIILAFSNIFSLNFIVSPSKFIIAFLVLSIGIISLNLSIVFARFFYRKLGIPYVSGLIVASVLYFLISNGITILLIASGAILYIVFQLIILAIFLFILSTILIFAKSK